MIYSDVAQTWEEAQLFCQNLGGHLATITSKDENDSLYAWMTSLGYKNAYFGFSDSVNEGYWHWVTNEGTEYANWHKGEPNSESSNEDYAMFYWKFTDGTGMMVILVKEL